MVHLCTMSRDFTHGVAEFLASARALQNQARKHASIAAWRKHGIVRGDAVGDRHGTVVFMQHMAAVAHVIAETAGHIAEAYSQVMVSAAQQESCAGRWLLRTGLVASERVRRHIVGGRR